MNISKVAPIAACLLAATLVTPGCQSVQQFYGDIRGTNPACTRIAEYTSQAHNKRSFVGLADNVFVGKVEASDGQHVEGRDLYSLFKVQVISNLKGQLAGQITVSQIGGHHCGDGAGALEPGSCDRVVSVDALEYGEFPGLCAFAQLPRCRPPRKRECGLRRSHRARPENIAGIA